MATSDSEGIFLPSILDGMLAFPESPAVKYDKKVSITSGKAEKKIDVAELFSIFTADIIREEVIFTR